MKKQPEIRIYFADLLYLSESQQLAKDRSLESYDQYQKYTQEYRKEWNKIGSKILIALQEILEVNFYQSVLDVACAPFFIPKSQPLIMNFRNKPDQFVDVLTHEICHVILTDNNVSTIVGGNPKIDLVNEWTKLFGKEHDFTTLVHIPVHAICKYLFVDVLQEPLRFERDVKESSEYYYNSGGYARAWQYVNDHDYMEIIEQLRLIYKNAKVSSL